MDFVNVTASLHRSRIRIGDDVTGAACRLTRRSLFSLIGGLRQTRAGPDTLLDQIYEIQEYRERYVTPCQGKLYIDSGGYSIITGEVKSHNIIKTIKTYHLYPRLYPDDFDFLFTLDIPIVPNDLTLNTRKGLYTLNYKSLADTKKLLQQSKLLRDKMILVWQFKIPGQYEIWSEIYKELSLNDLIRNRAIGGLVGLHQALRDVRQSIDFSPVIAMPFRCLLDHLTKKDVDQEFRLHFLGVKIKVDRFMIALIERLFELYLEGISEVVFTYDSINYNSTSMFSTNLLLECWSFNNDNLHNYKNILSVPEGILRSMYFTENMYKNFIKEIKHIKNGEDVENSDILSPLNIYSNMQIDRYFSEVIKEYYLAENILNSNTILDVYPVLNNMMKKLKVKQPKIFTNRLEKQINTSIDYLYKFHQWYCIRRDYESLDDMIKLFVKMINFPMDLK